MVMDTASTAAAMDGRVPVGPTPDTRTAVTATRVGVGATAANL